MRSTTRLLVLTVAVAFASGCASQIAQSKVVQQAAFDHNCPENQIKVVKANTDIWAYNLDVCGKPMKYRDLGNSKEFQFVDVTNGIPSGFHRAR